MVVRCVAYEDGGVMLVTDLAKSKFHSFIQSEQAENDNIFHDIVVVTRYIKYTTLRDSRKRGR